MELVVDGVKLVTLLLEMEGFDSAPELFTSKCSLDHVLSTSHLLPRGKEELVIDLGIILIGEE